MNSVLTAAAACIALSSCSLDKTVAPMAPTPFLASTGTDVSQKISRLPFEHSWRDPNADMTEYKNIVIRPVTVRYLRTTNWDESKSPEITSRRAFEKRAAALARHFTEQLNTAFSDPICVFYKTSDTSKPGTLILEVALTEVRFADPQLPSLTDNPFCAFEARVRDAQTGKLISTAADRRGPDLHLSTEGSQLTYTKEICAIWSRQLMEASNKEIFSSVRRKFIAVE